MNAAELEIWRTVERLNATWTSGRVDELEQFFHDGMVAITPTDRLRLEGRDACVASWRRFVERAAIREWKTSDPLVRVFGEAAMATYYYDMLCEIDSKVVRLSGRDMFVLVHEGGRWLVVADQFSEFPGMATPAD